jgi:GT2 family glycosyltransferase
VRAPEDADGIGADDAPLSAARRSFLGWWTWRRHVLTQGRRVEVRSVDGVPRMESGPSEEQAPLRSDRSSLPSRWTLLRVLDEEFAAAFHPVLLVRAGRSTAAWSVLELPVPGPRRWLLAKLPADVRALRLVRRSGAMQTSPTVICREVGKLLLVPAIVALEEPGRRLHRARSLLGALLRAGLRGLKHEVMKLYRRQFLVRLADPEAVRLWWKAYDRPLPYPTASRLTGSSRRLTIVIDLAFDGPRDTASRVLDALSASPADSELWCVHDDREPTDRTIALGSDPRVRLVPRSRVGAQQLAGRRVLLLPPRASLLPALGVRLLEQEQGEFDLLYGDVLERDISDSGDVAPFLKGGFSYDRVLSDPAHIPCFVVRGEHLRDSGGLPDRVTESTVHDTLLHCLERPCRVAYVADVLTERNATASSESHDIVGHIIRRHLERLGWDGSVRPGAAAGAWSVTHCAESSLRVGVVIPTRDRVDLLRRCVDTLFATSMSQHPHVCVVDHDSQQSATMRYLAELAGRAQVIQYSGVFNYSRMMNRAVAQLPDTIDAVLFLNNDVEALQPGWLESMTLRLARPDVGVVGATLVYPGGMLQHMGTVLGPGGAADHVPRREPFFDRRGRRLPGYGRAFIATRDVTAVTGACMLIRRELLEAIGGFDERLAVGFNDTDLCLRVRERGLRVLVDADAVLMHHESATRARSLFDPHPDDTLLFSQARAEMVRGGDSFHPPLLSIEAGTYALRRGVSRAPLVRPLVCEHRPPRRNRDGASR